MNRNRTIIYARVSTKHHDQNPEVQIDELRRYCAAQRLAREARQSKSKK